MFTGLIQHIGTVRALETGADGSRLRIDIGPLAADAKLGDSIATDGVCLTVTGISGSVGSFDAVPETLRRTTLGTLKPGSRVNLEASLAAGAKLGGHFVQGHVDTRAEVVKTVEGGRWAEWHLQLADQSYAEQIVEKGSIAIDGISLTVAGCDARQGTFWVALIPETLARTTLAGKKQGASVNIETDILGKYVLAALKARLDGTPAPKPFAFDEAKLRENGF
jgi:riboflavin synthase